MHVRLVPRLTWGDVDVTDTPFMLLMDPDFSQGENLYEVLETELFDGSSVSSDSTENRTPTFRVAIIDSPDQESLALAGARLDREAEKPRNLLTFDPGDGFGAPWSVETYRAQTRVERLDDLEQSMIRIYEIEMQAAPHVRSVAPVVIPATGSGDPTPPPAPVETVIYDGSSIAGWSGEGGVLSPGSPGVVLAASVPSGSGANLRLTYEPDFSMGSDELLAIMHSKAGPISLEGLRVEAHYATSPNVEALTPLSSVGNWTYYRVPAGRTVLQLTVSGSFFDVSGRPFIAKIAVEQIKTASGMPYSGTARQLFRSFEVHGTARTSGTLRLSHANALGSVLVWSGAESGSYQPPSRRFKVGGGADVPDTDAASGARTNISASPFEIEVPVGQLPDGLYRVAARVKADTAGEAFFTRTYTTVGSPLASFTPTGTVTPPHNLTTEYRIVDLGTEMISGAYGSSLSRRMTVQATGTGTGTVWLDELYLLNTSTGAVVQVEAGAAKHVWINAPTVATPFPTLLGGIEEDGSDAVRLDPVADIFQPAAWSPGTINLFTACGQPNLAAEAEYYPRFLHNAYEVVL